MTEFQNTDWIRQIQVNKIKHQQGKILKLNECIQNGLDEFID